jgi:uncharacterized membrane protein
VISVASDTIRRTPAAEQPVQRSWPTGWLELSSLGLALAGLAVSLYLTIEHYTASTTLACPETGVVNCVKVTTSAQSIFLGIPVALLGLLYFAAMCVLVSPQLWRAKNENIERVRLGAAAVGVVMAIYLIGVELFSLNAICLWCTAVHAIAFALLGVIGVGTALRRA